MKYEADVIWRKGDGEMPPDVKHIVDVARGELLLESLELPVDVANTVRYNADKSAQSINNYISGLVIERIVTA